MTVLLDDGAAAAACRALLRDKGVGGDWNWRTTVVTRDGPEYVVRIWVHVPVRRPRPAGTPDHVYVATRSADSDSGFRISQVHPAA